MTVTRPRPALLFPADLRIPFGLGDVLARAVATDLALLAETQSVMAWEAEHPDDGALAALPGLAVDAVAYGARLAAHAAAATVLGRALVADRATADRASLPAESADLAAADRLRQHVDEALRANSVRGGPGPGPALLRPVRDGDYAAPFDASRVGLAAEAQAYRELAAVLAALPDAARPAPPGTAPATAAPAVGTWQRGVPVTMVPFPAHGAYFGVAQPTAPGGRAALFQAAMLADGAFDTDTLAHVTPAPGDVTDDPEEWAATLAAVDAHFGTAFGARFASCLADAAQPAGAP